VNTPPQVQITSPVDGTSFEATESITLEATASDAGGSIARVEFRMGTTSLATDTTAPYTHTIPAGTLAAGDHAFTALATDNLGAMATSSAVTITIASANQAPSVAIATPEDGSVVIQSTAVSIEATASDADGTVTAVEFLVNSEVVFVAGSAPYVFTLETEGMSPGPVEVLARALDEDGGSTDSEPLTIFILAEVQVQAVSVSAEGAFEMAWESPEGVVFTVEASDDLVTWTSVATITAASQGARFTASTAEHPQKRYFRVHVSE